MNIDIQPFDIYFPKCSKMNKPILIFCKKCGSGDVNVNHDRRLIGVYKRTVICNKCSNILIEFFNEQCQ